MIFDKDGIAFPDYQQERGIFNKSINHDLQQWEVVKSHLKDFRTCLDFGAHVGTSAIRYSKRFQRVMSFEPIPELFECLEYNTKDCSNVEIHNVAISDKNETVEILVNWINTGSSMIPSESTKKVIDTRWGNERRKEFQEMPKLKVDSRTIDSYNIEDVDFIKIDTEGYNIQPLWGMEKTLKRCSPVIQLERSNDESYLPETHDFLKGLGYKLVKTIGNPPDDIFVKE